MHSTMAGMKEVTAESEVKDIPLSNNEFSENTDNELTENEEANGKHEQHASRPLVLLVEDDLDMNEFICQSLTSQYKVKSTFNGKEALEIARKLDPEIIISDIMMPEMDGLELGRLLQSDINTSHIPILYLTAKTTRENEMEGLQVGAVDYIYKPFSMSALRLKITNILSQRNALRESVRKADLLEPEHITLTSLDDQFLKDAVEAVNNHLDDTEFDVEKLSHVIGLSSNQTYRKLKALTGQTAKEFIRNQRLKTAAMLLLQKRRSVSEIIYMVGFSSPSYFTRCFREYYGCTPSEYIENESKSV
jgi:DNA-binding response OmpR family regulator